MIAALVFVTSAAAFFLSTGFGVVWPLAWIAPIPVLLFAFRNSWRLTALVAFLASLAGSLTIVGTFRVGGWIVFGAPPAIAFMLSVLVSRAAVRRLPPWIAALAFPIAFTAYEFLYASWSPNGTYWSLGYSQTDVLPLLQISSLTGMWGVIFVVTFVPSAVAVAWHERSRAPIAVALVVTLAVCGYGAARLSSATREGGARVGVMALDGTGGPVDAIARAYADRIGAMQADGVELVIVPEKLIVVPPTEESSATALFRAAAMRAGVTVVVGVNRASEPRHNVALVIAPSGEVSAEYEKHHLVPLIEREFTPGSTPRLFTGPGAQWGVEICKDLDFPAWSRQYGRRGVRLLAVPALDFVKDGRLHSRMALVRGVENGFAVARAAGQGRVTLSDAYGRIVAEQESAGLGSVTGVLPAGPGATPYTRYGDWFGWTIVVFFAGLVLAVVVKRRAVLSRPPLGRAEL